MTSLGCGGSGSARDSYRVEEAPKKPEDSDARLEYSKIHNYWRVVIFFRTAGIKRVSRPYMP